jgi:hypothetical protein
MSEGRDFNPTALGSEPTFAAICAKVRFSNLDQVMAKRSKVSDVRRPDLASRTPDLSEQGRDGAAAMPDQALA